jgi:rubrerythrin
MKRAFFVLLSVALAAGALAGARVLPSQVRSILEDALAGERAAIVRYESFAAKAEADGYAGAAALFRAQAKAERTHAARFAALLGVEAFAPSNEPVTASSGSTAENLRAAVMAETAERDGLYRKAVEICNTHGATDIAKVFDQVRDTEVEHANLCMAGSRDLKSLRDPKTFYVCDHCGYTTDVKLPYCPSCQHKRALTAVQ